MAKPDFLIVGAPKAGTSSIARYLAQHPELYLPDRKDVPFLGSDLEYRRHRPPLADHERWFDEAGNRSPGYAATQYLQSKLAADELARWAPNAKIIIALRDPVAAMRSMHGHLHWLGDEDIPDFEQALAAEPERRAGRLIPPQTAIPGDLIYRDVFTYHAKVERYVRRFDRNGVAIILFEDLKNDAAGTMRRLHGFLGVEPATPSDLAIENEAKGPRFRGLHSLTSRPPQRLVDAYRRLTPSSFHGRLVPALERLNTRRARRDAVSSELETRLRAEAAEDVRQLAGLIGRDLSAWLPAQPTRSSA